ncbi:Zn-dependent protease with chaperone function [Alteromonadaceae bacterium Bs31]|nr:Zn-dependent protease with chaperone function [Alteromonadaceae bacterium Bs31]
MNFFQHQDAARQKTGLLVGLLILAVASLIAITVIALGVFFYFFQTYVTSVNAAQAQNTPLLQHLIHFAQTETALWVALAVITVVAMGTIYKYLQLSGGGKKVAEALGGRPLTYDGANDEELKTLNVVEEMAIASGNPVPPVYVIEDAGINAFAAGLSRRDAVIGVTRGCINLLNRDELQGVIAHEFSHIHNGDMRLNMRLVAVLHGVLIIGLIGYVILRGSSARRYGSRSKGAGAQLGLGLALVAIGYGGTFFGSIIKSAVSRQREFLADASAVQFTRNPPGIGNALKKIGGFHEGSLIGSSAASQFSHMYFCQGIKSALGGMMATHPPLHDRIRRVLPDWNGGYIHPDEELQQTQRQQTKPHAASMGFAAQTQAIHGEQFSGAAIGTIGEPGVEHVQHARAVVEAIPQILRDAAHQPFSARALIYCLLLDNDRAVRTQQIAHLQDSAHPSTFQVMKKLYQYVFQLPRTQHIALIEMTIPALKLLSAPQYKVFKNNLKTLIQADRKVSLFEWCVYRIVTNNAEAKVPEVKYSLSDLPKEISLIFSLIVDAGKSASPGGAFQKGVEAIGLKNVKFTLNTDDFSYRPIDEAIQKLSELKLLQKPRLLKAMTEIISADGVVTPVEAELFRAIADSMDCPVPPLVS